MSQADVPPDFDLRLRAAQLHLELDRRRGAPSPDWVHAAVAEGQCGDEDGAGHRPL